MKPINTEITRNTLPIVNCIKRLDSKIREILADELTQYTTNKVNTKIMQSVENNLYILSIQLNELLRG